MIQQYEMKMTVRLARRAQRLRRQRTQVGGVIAVVGLACVLMGGRFKGMEPAQLPVNLPLTVQQGDTLWTLAQRFGDPGEYILRRVDAIAIANHLSARDTLTPGQRLVIPVTNPVEVARLSTAAARVASR